VTTPEEWLAAQADRVMDRQRSQVDAAKLVSTFSVSIAAALVASALQAAADSPSADERWATWTLAAAIMLTIAVILSDRLVEPNHSRVLELAAIGHWPEHRTIFELRAAATAATYANEGNVRIVRGILWIQLATTVLSGAIAAYSLLRGLEG
jgi:hypothetical protein